METFLILLGVQDVFSNLIQWISAIEIIALRSMPWNFKELGLVAGGNVIRVEYSFSVVRA